MTVASILHQPVRRSSPQGMATRRSAVGLSAAGSTSVPRTPVPSPASPAVMLRWFRLSCRLFSTAPLLPRKARTARSMRWAAEAKLPAAPSGSLQAKRSKGQKQQSEGGVTTTQVTRHQRCAWLRTDASIEGIRRLKQEPRCAVSLTAHRSKAQTVVPANWPSS